MERCAGDLGGGVTCEPNRGSPICPAGASRFSAERLATFELGNWEIGHWENGHKVDETQAVLADLRARIADLDRTIASAGPG